MNAFAMRKFFCYLFLAMGLWQSGCLPYEDERLMDVTVDLKDPVFQQIHDYQDRQQMDSLYQFFNHENATYRYLSAVAFGSIRQPEAINQLVTLLSDEVPEVRAGTAYALGQIGDAAAEEYLIDAFDQTDTAGVYKKAHRAILEAIGKCGKPETLELLGTISTYEPTDTALLEGQAWGIYRYALRGITSRSGTDRMVELAANTSYPQRIRFIAANYLSRAQDIQLDSLQAAPLARVFQNETNANIRMALAMALGKAQSSTARQALIQQYQKETDYRVKCDILRALRNFPYEEVQALAIQAVRDPNIHVATRAAQFFVANGIPQDATLYWRLAKDTVPAATSIELYGAALRHISPAYQQYRNAMNYELRRRFQDAESPYLKAAALRALAEWGWNFRFIQRNGFDMEQHPAVRTASVEALAGLCQNDQFSRFFGNSTTIARELSIYLKEAIRTGDPGMVAAAAGGLRVPERNFQAFLADSLVVFENALNELELPKEIETYNALAETIAFLRGNEDFEPRKPTYNHPIDWEVFNTLTMDSRVIIRTSRGDITMRLLPDIAPGSCVNFVRLAKDGFYDGKNFHRVVPNFVIQGGCPRGDGYGSLDYTIRSELPMVYYDREGLVGMASAGNHTEGVQFFITHAPAPHLDGNYTIFGRVIEGMDVVHDIRPGDVINRVIVQ